MSTAARIKCLQVLVLSIVASCHFFLLKSIKSPINALCARLLFAMGGAYGKGT